MLIRMVCNECRLTKKAIEYYEKQGLIEPLTDANGYRSYTEMDINLLKEISVLRKLGISVSDIKLIVNSSHKLSALRKYQYIFNLKQQRAATQMQVFDQLIDNYDIEWAFHKMEDSKNECFTIIEKLVQAFPGSYGIYVAAHFGQFLDGTIDSKEKESAYYRILEFLDTVTAMKISEELESYMEDFLSSYRSVDMEEISRKMVCAVNDPNDFIEENKELLDEYLEYRASKEFHTSTAYQIQQLLLEFQKNSGYQEIFLPALRILSSSYQEYCKKLEEANEVFIEKYPKAKLLYENYIEQ